MWFVQTLRTTMQLIGCTIKWRNSEDIWDIQSEEGQPIVQIQRFPTIVLFPLIEQTRERELQDPIKQGRSGRTEENVLLSMEVFSKDQILAAIC